MFHRPPENFLYCAYQIKTKYSDGINFVERAATCFILEIGTGIPYIITNRHVMDINYNKLATKYKDYKLISIQITGRKPSDIAYTVSINSDTPVFFHRDYNNDVALILPLTKQSAENEKFHFHFTLSHLPNEEEFNRIFPSDIICFAGFPQTHDKLMGRPILRCGTIASDPKYSYSWDKNHHGSCVAYEGFSTEGASGSPVLALAYGFVGNMLNARIGYLIGINAGHIPEDYGHSGISYFYKSTLIKEIIAENKLQNIKDI